MNAALCIQVNGTCFAVIAVIAFSLERRKTGKSAERILDIVIFRDLAYSTLVMIILDTVGWVLDGVPGKAASVALESADAICFGLYTIPISLYILYADFQIHRAPSRSKRLLRPLVAIAGAVAATSLVSPFTGFLFSLDEANRFVRGPAFPAFAAILFGLVAWSIGLVVAGRKKVAASVFWTLLAYPIPVTAAALARYLSYGLDLVWSATTVFLVMAAFNIQRRRASTDHLTGAANRRSLDEELERLVEGGRQARPFGGIMADLDEFKSINDCLGHEAGDRALEDAAAILRASVRSGDMVTRYGGDEFVVLVPNATRDSLAEIVERVVRRTEARNASDETTYKLSFSMGASLYDPVLDGSASRFLSRLDDEMYRDKTRRKGAGIAGAAAVLKDSGRICDAHEGIYRYIGSRNGGR